MKHADHHEVEAAMQVKTRACLICKKPFESQWAGGPRPGEAAHWGTAADPKKPQPNKRCALLVLSARIGRLSLTGALMDRFHAGTHHS
jgi:hypothetical protein